MKYLIFLLILTGCAVQPEYQDNPYQAKAFELIQGYNSKHGTNVPVPVVRIGSLPNLEEGHTFCPSVGSNCWITINENWDIQRHGDGYAMTNILPHELAHHVCIYLGKCPRGEAGNYHGPEWKEIALEFGLSPDDSFIKPR